MNQRQAIVWVLGAWLTLAAAGCVGQQPYDQLHEAYRKQGEQIVELRALLDEKNAEIAALQAQSGDSYEMRRRLAALQAEREQLAAQLRRLEEQMQGLSPGAMLPAELNQALIDLAAAHPDLMTYDPALGMVRFRSDLTFALGSAEVSPAGQQALTRLAGILRSAAAAQYEVHVVGHTDNVPIRQPRTREQHPTNWHLSAHRAISVKDVLAGAGVEQVRIMVAGFGEHRPVAPNQGAQGNPANRRVEIFLRPMTYRGAYGPAQPAATPTKDGGATAPAPVRSPAEPPEAFK